MWKSPLAALLVASSLLARSAAAAEPPKVVVSFQPLHSLVAAVMEGVGTPTALVTGTASEHTYALKPSDAKAMRAARLVVLIDPDYEGFLRKPLRALGPQAEVLAVADLPGIARLPLREGGVWAAHEQGHEAHHDHHEEAFDGHLWLDVANAKVMVAAVAARLSRLDPANAPRYTANAAALGPRLDALDAEIRAKVAPAAGKPYVVFHDAYQYFERRYGLSPAGSLTVDPDRPPSARRVAALRDRLKQARGACVFREPQFPATVVQTLAEAAGTRVGILDPQGATLPPGPEQYFSLMRNLASSLTECLSAP
ncbi:MAG: zinc ABC transporter substrate-binding protein [Magnetospirillum sp.]|nr:zinc ABC transporter substrate-binding protein [Magnetospirillum sp.]